MKCLNDDCEGVIEASGKVYLDVDDAEATADGDITIKALSFSVLNDELHGHPVAMEGEFYVGCSDCGREYEGRLDRDLILNAIAPQPIGDAPRELGRRGGT